MLMAQSKGHLESHLKALQTHAKINDTALSLSERKKKNDSDILPNTFGKVSEMQLKCREV